MIRSAIVVLAAGFALAACGDILPKPAPPPALYRLTAATDFPRTATTAPVQLQIEIPSAEAGLDTTRIALSRSATTLDYFADAAWTDRLPLMVQDRLLESFENSHRLVAFASAGSARGGAILAVQLRHFEAQYAGEGPPRWRIELSAALIEATDRKVIASRSFTGGADAARNDMATIVESADEAWRAVAAQIVEWAADTLTRRPR
jgi:cholesterol transport system auxiliary component